MKKLSSVVYMEEADSPLVLTLPHSGTKISQNLWHHFALGQEHAMKTFYSGIDYCVPFVTGFLECEHATRIGTTLPRVILDVNRGLQDVDSLSVEGGRKEPKPHGLIWRSSMEYHPHSIKNILTSPYTQTELDALIAEAYTPFVNAVHDAMHKARDKYGFSVLVDLHSLPPNKWNHVKSGENKNAYLAGKLADIGPMEEGKMPELILMNGGGKSCSSEISDWVMELFTSHGFHIQNVNGVAASTYECSRNRYPDPENGLHSFAIEIVGHHGLEPGRGEGKLIYEPQNNVDKRLKQAFHTLFYGLCNSHFNHKHY